MSSQEQLTSLEQLDSNFRQDNSRLENGVRWRDSSEFTIEGQGWPQESRAYTRYPYRAYGVVRDDVWNLSSHSAGISVHFETDSAFIAVRWRLESKEFAMSHMTATGVSGLDLYARNDSGSWLWVGSGQPKAIENEVVLLENVEPDRREYCLYLPLYNGTISVEIGVADGAGIGAAEVRNQQPMCFYGSSIVQGGCATRPGMAYPAILSQQLDVPHFNLGFSGNAKAEIEVANLLAELNPSLFVLDPLPNMSAELVRERIGPFVQALREKHPVTPILLLECLYREQAWIRPDMRKTTDGMNRALFEVWEELEAAGVPHLHYVRFNERVGETPVHTVDGIHPTDMGFKRMADVLEPVIRPLLP